MSEVPLYHSIVFAVVRRGNRSNPNRAASQPRKPENGRRLHATLETTFGQMAPPTSGHPLKMPPESGSIPGRVHF